MNGIELIEAERNRQIYSEGWTADHDDQHQNGQLIQAAIAYAVEGSITTSMGWWPESWDLKFFKRQGDVPTDRDLAKAGALIAAELDRRARARLR